MCCVVVLLALAFPRLALVLMFLFSNYLERAYHSLLLVILGFIFLPFTTIIYAWVVNGHHPVDGIYLVAIIVAVLADVGLIGHGAYQKRRS
jgi:drug/metabolite transporter (DMT)-like permease